MIYKVGLGHGCLHSANEHQALAASTSCVLGSERITPDYPHHMPAATSSHVTPFPGWGDTTWPSPPEGRGAGSRCCHRGAVMRTLLCPGHLPPPPAPPSQVDLGSKASEGGRAGRECGSAPEEEGRREGRSSPEPSSHSRAPRTAAHLLARSHPHPTSIPCPSRHH